jgi:UDP-N-acetyl-D-glucosamine dehydrogenase
MEKLRDLGAEISYSDPHVLVFPKMREHRFDLSSVPLTADVLAGFDCVLLATDHRRFDYDLIRHHSKLIVDTRGVYREKFGNVVSA